MTLQCYKDIGKMSIIRYCLVELSEADLPDILE